MNSQGLLIMHSKMESISKILINYGNLLVFDELIT